MFIVEEKTNVNDALKDLTQTLAAHNSTIINKYKVLTNIQQEENSNSKMDNKMTDMAEFNARVDTKELLNNRINELHFLLEELDPHLEKGKKETRSTRKQIEGLKEEKQSSVIVSIHV